MEEASKKTNELIVALLSHSDQSLENELEFIKDEAAVQRNTKLCADLLHAIQEMRSLSSLVEDHKGSYKRERSNDSDRGDRFIHTSIEDYNNKSIAKNNSSISIRNVIGSSISSKDVDSLVAILTSFFTHRVQILPATQDDAANTEVMNDDVSTLSELSLVSATVYTQLIGMQGAFGIGLIDVGALSGLAALVRRWGVECSGRVKILRKNKGSKNEQKIVLEEDDIESPNLRESGVSIKDHNDNSKNESIEGGLELVKSLPNALKGEEFRSWNCDAREAFIDSCVLAISFTAALLSTNIEWCESQTAKTMHKSLCGKIVNSISKSIHSCVVKCVTEAGSNAANTQIEIQDESSGESLDAMPQHNQLNLNAQRETVVYVLRSLYPFLAHQIAVPNEVKGKEAAYKSASSLISSIMATISQLVENGYLRKYGTSSRFTPQRVPRTSLSKTPLSEICPNTSMKKTPRSLKKKNQSDDFPIVPPSLKKSATPKRRCRRSSIVSRRLSQNSSTVPTNQSENMLDVFVGMMQKMSTIKGLERAEVRSRISFFLKECLRTLPNNEKIRFLEFTTQICLSKMSSHRLFGVELIGDILLMDFIWDADEENHERSQCGTLRHTMSTTITRKINGITEERHCSISDLMLEALRGRILDRAQAIRARAAHSLAKILKSINSDERTLCPEAERCLIRSINRVRPALISCLSARAGSDSKATVRKGAITAYIELILLDDFDGIENDMIRLTTVDVSMLCQMCNDSSLSVRQTAAKAIATLLHKQHTFQGTCFDSGLLESAFADFVLPLALDVESSCAETVVNLFYTVVINPLLVVGDGVEDDGSHLRKKLAYSSSWKVLARFSNCISTVGASKSSRRSLLVVLDKILNTKDSVKQNKPTILLSEIFHVISSSCIIDPTRFTEEYPGQGDDAIWQIGAWYLLEALSDLYSIQRNKSSSSNLNLERDVGKSALDIEFICSSWKALFKLTNKAKNDVRKKSIIVAISKSCLRVLSKLAEFMEAMNAEQLSISLEKLMRSFALCPDLIGAATITLVATTKRINYDSSRKQFIDASAVWIDSIFKECERTLDSYITTGLDAHDEETHATIERALSTTGEMCMIGFTANESNTRRKCLSLLSEIGEGQEDLAGIYVKIPDHLVCLVQALLPPTLPSTSDDNQKVMKPTSDLIRAHAFITLGKVCIRNETMAKDCINIFAQELRRSSDGNTAAQSNALIILGDLCVRYANLVDRFLPLMASCLQSQKYHVSEGKRSEPTSFDTNSKSSILKQHAVLILANLLIQDYIKWKGDLFHRFLMASVDLDHSVSNLAKIALSGPLLAKQPNLFFSNFVDLVFVLNGCAAHPVRAKFNAATKTNSRNLTFPRVECKRKRVDMYLILLRQMTDEEKIGITARLVREILGETIHSTGALSQAIFGHSQKVSSTYKKNKEETQFCFIDENAYHVVADCLTILVDPNLCIGKGSKKEDDVDEDIDTLINTNGSSASQLSFVKSKLLSKISRKHMVETAIPTLSSLKIILEKNRSPLLKDVMTVMVTIYRQFKNEVSEILATDPTLLQELQYESKNCKQNQDNITKKGNEIGVSSPEIWADERAGMNSVGSYMCHSKRLCSLSK